MRPSAAAVGTFDGVHRGHLAVLDTLRAMALPLGLEPMAVTFDRHPLSLIAPERAPGAITTVSKKVELIRKAGVEPVVIPFDEELRATSARDWMGMMREKLGVRLLVVGYDNTFGCDGVNLSIADYRRIGDSIGIEVAEAPVIEGISSSAIRKAIIAGDVGEASAMMGRRFQLPGIVVGGNRLGRTIGFPTANLMTSPGLVRPANGVYAAFALLPDGETRDAMVNIGVRPTIRRGNDPTIEAHIIGWEGELYGQELTLSFIGRLRDEERFNTIDALRNQLEKDLRTAKTVCESQRD